MGRAYEVAELRVSISGDERWLRVMDGMVAADPTLDRSKITRSILDEWGARKEREASLIVRFAADNAAAPESSRRRSG